MTTGDSIPEVQPSSVRDHVSKNNGGGLGAGEMVQQLRALAVLAEDLGWVLSIPMVTHNYNSSARRSHTLCWPLWAADMYVVYIHTCMQLYTYTCAGKSSHIDFF